MNAAAKRGLASLARPATVRHEEPAAPAGKAPRGTAKRPAIAVRAVSREDWIEMHDFALRQGKSLNRLLLEGFAKLQREAGVKPINTELDE